jgi:histidine triad (HIT) family protein
MPSVFTKIFNKEISCHQIFEDELTFAFLDINPHVLGHTLLVPKIEIGTHIELPEPYYTRLFLNAKIISKAVLEATKAKRIGMAVHGMGIPEHFHLHIVPMFTAFDLDQNKAHKEPEQIMEEIAQKIRSFLD